MPPYYVSQWHAFEGVVAQLYRKLGAKKVIQNYNLAGNEIDVYVEEETSSGQLVRIAVECKYYKKPVSKTVVLQFATIAYYLKQNGIVDKAAVIGYQGFTQSAFLVGQSANIELVNYSDLEKRVEDNQEPGEISEVKRAIQEAEIIPMPLSFPNTVFVLMPFSEDMEDLYIYGIRKCVQEFGLKCKRADEIEHEGSIIDEVIDNIKRCRMVIAEVTTRNPNVYYEVGWAHALEKETILIARNGSELPFDIKHINTIMYKNIHDLENRLKRRLNHKI